MSNDMQSLNDDITAINARIDELNARVLEAEQDAEAKTQEALEAKKAVNDHIVYHKK